MNYFAQMLMADVRPLFEPTTRMGETRHREKKPKEPKYIDNYRLVFELHGPVLSSTKFAHYAGVTQGSVVLRVLEEKGYVQVVGTEATGGTKPRLLFEWIEQ